MKILPSLLVVLTAACTTAPSAPRNTVRVVEPPPPPPAEISVPEPMPAPIATASAPIVEELIPEDRECPVAVSGTTVAFVETEAGAALMFSTEQIAEVSARLDAIAGEHNAINDLPPPPSFDPVAADDDDEDWGDRDDTVHASGGARVNRATGTLPVRTPSQARVEIFATGVRLIYTAEPTDLERLREELRRLAIAMATGQCPERR